MSLTEERDMKKSRLTRWLESERPSIRVGYAIAAAFCTYFCMYAFRKPVFAAQF